MDSMRRSSRVSRCWPASTSPSRALVLAQLGRGPEAEQPCSGARSLVPANAYAAFLETSALGSPGALAREIPSTRLHGSARSSSPCVASRSSSPGSCAPSSIRSRRLVELGRREEASELLEWYEGHARRLERASALANSARCRGLLAAQAGELDEALAAYERGARVALRRRPPARPRRARSSRSGVRNVGRSGGARRARRSRRRSASSSGSAPRSGRSARAPS